MDISKYNLIQAGFKASGHTPTEAVLTMRHGNLHDFIPNELNKRAATLADVAKTLGVSTSWVSRWLSDNGYSRTTRWERK